MARQIISGPAGSTWTNDTPRVLYQFFAGLQNTCGVCLQYHRQIGPWWPIPLHFGCRCHQQAIRPGETSDPFVNYRELLAKMTHAQQVAAVGASCYRLIESGAVQWSDVVTEGRIRALREVVSRGKLSVDRLIRAGVQPSIAQTAHASVNTPAHQLAEEQRRIAMARLTAAGIPAEQLVQELAGRLAARASVRPVGPVAPAAPRGPAGPGAAAVIAQALAEFRPPQANANAKAPAGEPVPPRPAPASPPSRAVLGYADEGWETVAKRTLGRDVTSQQMLDLSGAGDGRASIAIRGDDELSILVRSDRYELSRTLRRGADGRPVLVAENFDVKPQYQGQGIGADVFGRMVDSAERLGVARIETTAAGGPGQNGYWTWPRFGYDAPIPADLAARLPRGLAGATRISDLMASPEGSQWWHDHGRTISARFDLMEGSRSLEIWRAYQAEKQARTAR